MAHINTTIHRHTHTHIYIYIHIYVTYIFYHMICIISVICVMAHIVQVFHMSKLGCLTTIWGHDCYRCLVPCYAQQDPQRIHGPSTLRVTSNWVWQWVSKCFQAPGASENSIFRSLSSSVCDLSCENSANNCGGENMRQCTITSCSRAGTELIKTATHRIQSQSLKSTHSMRRIMSLLSLSTARILTVLPFTI